MACRIKRRTPNNQQTPLQQSIEIKPGVAELFESNPELASIGTQEQYSQYLDTIFPDSEISDIVWHQSKALEKFEKFDDQFSKENGDYGKAFYFSTKENLDNVWNEKALNNITFRVAALLNIQNSLISPDNTSNVESPTMALQNGEYDAVIDYYDETAPNYRGETYLQIALKNPDNIHILGSKQDIEGFKEFIDKQTIEEDNSLENKIINFLTRLNIDIKEVDSIKDITGYDAQSATDLIYKTVLLKKEGSITDDLLTEAAYVALKFLGKRNKIYTDLISNLNKIEKYKEIIDDYKKKHPNLNEFKIKELVLIDLIADAIKNNYEIPRDSYINREASYWGIKGNSAFEKRLRYLLSRIKRFFDELFSTPMTITEYDDLLNDLANDVLNLNFSKFGTELSENEQLTNYEDTISKDSRAKQIVEDFAEAGLLLTGSLSLRKQGTLYRSEEEDLHDLDFTISPESFLTIIKQLNDEKDAAIEKIINNTLPGTQRDVLIDGVIIKYSNMSATALENADFFKKIKEKYPSLKKIRSFIGNNDQYFTWTGIIDDKYMIDIFTPDQLLNIESRNGFQNWQSILKAKFKMGRRKDLKDIANYIPFNATVDKLAQEKGFRHFKFVPIKSHLKKLYQGYNNLDNRDINYFTVNPVEAKQYGANVREVTIDTSQMVKSNSKEYDRLINEFIDNTGLNFDILDNSINGLQTQKQFFEFVKSKGFNGIDFTGFEDSQYVVSFDKIIDDQTIEEDNVTNNQVNYILKSIDILESDKAKQVFAKGKKNNWSLDKILTELQIPKEQKQLILNLGITDREQLTLELASKYSFVIEINTAKRKEGEYDPTDIDNIDPDYLEENKTTGQENTQYYSYLTVAGGTNYTENEIATPLITPSIKGHAEFATDNGVGWFRSDDKALISKSDEELSFPDEFIDNQGYQWKKINGVWNYFGDDGIDKRDDLTTADMINIHPQKEIFNYYNISKEGTKTRRILEVQSDLFQKGRDRKDLVQKNVKGLLASEPEGDTGIGIENPIKYQVVKRGNKYFAEAFYEYPDAPNDLAYSIEQGDDFNSYKKFDTKEEADNYLIELKNKINNIQGITKNSSENQFLQLLNKNNNWVTFFVKSIIQDSAKKGYEKVLFPTGDTASKVEGHTTLEEFKKQKEDRIKELEEKLKNIKQEPSDIYTKDGRYAFVKFQLERLKQGIIPESYITSTNLGGLLDSNISAFYHKGQIAIWQNKDINSFSEKFAKEESENQHGVKFWILKDNLQKDLIEVSLNSLENELKSLPEKILKREKESTNNEINQLKQELERVETEGFAALKPIYNFYENIVTNILKKQGYNPTLITDEHGNTWNEVILNKTRDRQQIQLQTTRPGIQFTPISKENFDKLNSILSEKLNSKIVSIEEFNKKLVELGEKPLQLKTANSDVHGAVLSDGTIYIDQSRLNANTLLHEHTHLFNQVIRATKPRLWNAIKKAIKETEEWSQISQDPLYSNLKNENQLADEVFATIVGRFAQNNWNRYVDRPFYEKVKTLIKKYFNTILEFFGVNVYKGLSARGLTELTLNELLGGVSTIPYQVDNQITTLLSDVFKRTSFFKDVRLAVDPKTRDKLKKALGERDGRAMYSIFGNVENVAELITFAKEFYPIKGTIERLYDLKILDNDYSLSYGEGVIYQKFQEWKNNNLAEKIEKEVADPQDLLKTIGYELVTFKSVGEALSIVRHFYREDNAVNELICTLKSNSRFETSLVTFIIRDDALETPHAFNLTQDNLTNRWKEYLKSQGKQKADGTFDLTNVRPQGDDPYSTSVVSLQIHFATKQFKEIGRYNHTIEDYDDTPVDNIFDKDFDNLIEGLSDAMFHKFNIDSSVDARASLTLNTVYTNKKGKVFFPFYQKLFGELTYVDKNEDTIIVDKNSERIAEGFLFKANGEYENVSEYWENFPYGDILKVNYIKGDDISVTTKNGDFVFQTKHGRIVKLKEYPKEWYFQYLSERYYKPIRLPNGSISINSLNDKNDGIIMTDEIEEIRGPITANEDFSIISLYNIKKAEVVIIREGSILEDLGQLKLANALRIEDNTLITNLGNLEKVSGNVIIQSKKVKNLGNIKYIGGTLEFKGTSLGKLKVILQDARIPHVEDMGNLQAVGGDIFIYNNLGNLMYVDAVYNYSDTTTSGNLRYVRAFRDIEGSITDLTNLEFVGNGDFRTVSSLGNLKYINTRTGNIISPYEYNDEIKALDEMYKKAFTDFANAVALGINVNFEDLLDPTISKAIESEIDQVLAANGKPSILFKNITTYVIDNFNDPKLNPIKQLVQERGNDPTDPKEVALVLYAQTQTEEFYNDIKTDLDQNGELKLSYRKPHYFLERTTWIRINDYSDTYIKGYEPVFLNKNGEPKSLIPGDNSQNDTPTLLESELSNIAASLSQTIGVPYRITYDINEPKRAYWDLLNNEIVFNAAHPMFASTPIHEFWHPIIFEVFTQNRELFDNLIKSLKKSSPELYNSVLNLYADKSIDVVEQEAIVKLLTDLVLNKLETQIDERSKSLLRKILDKVLAFLESIKIINRTPKKVTIAKLSHDTTLEQLATMFVNEQLTVTGKIGISKVLNRKDPVEYIIQELINQHVNDAPLAAEIDFLIEQSENEINVEFVSGNAVLIQVKELSPVVRQYNYLTGVPVYNMNGKLLLAKRTPMRNDFIFEERNPTIQKPKTVEEIRTALNVDTARMSLGFDKKYRLDNDTIVQNRVTDTVNTLRKKLFRNNTEHPRLDFLSQKGTIAHMAFELVMRDIIANNGKFKLNRSRIIDEVYSLLSTTTEFNKKPKSYYDIPITSFSIIVSNLENLYQHIKEGDPNAQIILEQKVYNPKTDTGGTIDILVLHSDGTASIYDYKTKIFKKLGKNKMGVTPRQEMLYDYQIENYKNILKSIYGVKGFRETRVIPVDVEFKENDFAKVDMDLFSLDPKTKHLRLLPVAGEDYGNEKNKTFERLLKRRDNLRAKLTVLKTPSGEAYDELISEYNTINEAIKQLQLFGNVQYVINNLQNFNARIAHAISSKEGIDNLTDKEVNNYLDMLEMYDTFLFDFKDEISELLHSRREAVKNEIDNAEEEYRLLDERISYISKALDYHKAALSQIIVERLNQKTNKDVLEGGVMQGVADRLFGGLASSQNPIFEILADEVRSMGEYVRTNTNVKIAQLKGLLDEYTKWANANGYQGVAIYQPLLNKKLKNLVAKYKPELFDKIEKLVNDFNNNSVIELKKLYDFDQKKYEIAVERYEKRLRDLGLTDVEIAYELTQYDNRYNLNNNKAWRYIQQNFFAKIKEDISEQYLSDEYKFIRNNKPALDLYEFFVETNREFSEITKVKLSDRFLPKVQKDFIDSLADPAVRTFASTNPLSGVKERFLNPLRIREMDELSGVYSPTGEKLNAIPFLYTDDLFVELTDEEKEIVRLEVEEKAKKQGIEPTSKKFNDMLEKEYLHKGYEKGRENLSTDLGMSYTLFIEAAFQYAYRTGLETVTTSLRRALSQQREIPLNNLGEKLVDAFSGGSEITTQYGDVSNKTLDTFESYVKTYVYGQSLQSEDFVLPGGYSASKMLRAVNTWQSWKYISMNPILSLVSWGGARINLKVLAKEGDLFNEDILRQAMKEYGSEKANLFLEQLEPSTRNLIREKALQLSASKLVQRVSQETIYWGIKKGDDNVSNLVMLAIAMNMVVENGDLKNPLSSRQSRLPQNNESKTLYDSFVKNDKDEYVFEKTVTPNVILKARTLVQYSMNRITGAVSPDYIAQINSTLLGQQLTKFRTWIPGLAKARFVKLGVNASTEEYQYGRYLATWQHLGDTFKEKSKDFLKMIAGVYDENGNINSEKIYAMWKAANTDMTEEAYKDFVNSRIKATATELRYIIGFMLLISMLSLFGFDDPPDEDENRVLYFFGSNTIKLLNRLKTELSFFVDPTASLDIVNSPIVLTREVKAVRQIISNGTDSILDILIGEDQKNDKAFPGYYILKNTPGISHFLTIMGIFERLQKETFAEDIYSRIR